MTINPCIKKDNELRIYAVSGSMAAYATDGAMINANIDKRVLNIISTPFQIMYIS
jgi:hypothetical protein